jgi:2-polyprenyl-3-methyl-5-hydroxy-6-metoxy-1,4-benzoquinol methylase
MERIVAPGDMSGNQLEALMWDDRYSAEHYIYGTTPNTFLATNAARIAKGKVLCLAAGEGRNAVFLATMGYTVTAVDASSVGLQKAQRLASKSGVSITTIHSRLEDFDLGLAAWDGIVSIFCHLPPLIRRIMHRKVVAGLRPAGVLLLEAYTPRQLNHGTGGPPTLELMISAAQLSDELSGLTFVRLKELEREVNEGTHHTGVASVVQVIAAAPEAGDG